MHLFDTRQANITLFTLNIDDGFCSTRLLKYGLRLPVIGQAEFDSNVAYLTFGSFLRIPSKYHHQQKRLKTWAIAHWKLKCS